MTETDKIQFFKMSHGMLPVMRQQLRFKYATSNTFPASNATDETIVHMLQYKIRNTEVWKIDLQKRPQKS